jgi:hypothetical protein
MRSHCAFDSSYRFTIASTAAAATATVNQNSLAPTTECRYALIEKPTEERASAGSAVLGSDAVNLTLQVLCAWSDLERATRVAGVRWARPIASTMAEHGSSTAVDADSKRRARSRHVPRSPGNDPF